MENLAPPSDDDIDDIVHTLASMCLGMEAERIPLGDSTPEDDLLIASVAITGAWTGSVAVSCSRALARRSAQAMFGTTDDVSEEQTSDALREIANIIAGNFKSLVSGPSRLSLPVLREPPAYEAGEGAAHRLGFDCGGHLLLVSFSPHQQRDGE